MAESQKSTADAANRELVAFRAPRGLGDEVRRLAQRDGETLASTFRRLLRAGLDLERRAQ